MIRKPPVLLVHGAWHGAWCWSHITPLLVQAGHKVVCPDLPGHSSNLVSIKSVTLTRYIDFILNIVRSFDEPVILAGHSMAGMVISAVADRIAKAQPEKIHCLLYINAYIPDNGDSIFSLMQTLHPDSEVAQAMTLSEDKRECLISDLSFKNLFYHQCSAELQAYAVASTQPQASLPLSSRIKLNHESFDQIKKVVLCSAGDKIIPPQLQRKMLHRQPCQEYVQIEGDHSLFYSAPREVAAIISAQ